MFRVILLIKSYSISIFKVNLLQFDPIFSSLNGLSWMHLFKIYKNILEEKFLLLQSFLPIKTQFVYFPNQFAKVLMQILFWITIFLKAKKTICTFRFKLKLIQRQKEESRKEDVTKILIIKMSEENSFAELYKYDVTKMVYLLSHFFLTIFGPSLLYSIIWYEKHSSDLRSRFERFLTNIRITVKGIFGIFLLYYNKTW